MTRAMTPPVPQPTVASVLAAARTPTLSLEFFPPKTLLGFGVLGSSIERMRSVRPDFTSCTYGAGGSRREHSFEAWELLARMGFSPVVAHLTCIGASRADLEEQIHRIHQAGIRNIMCLRGDPPQGETAFRPHPDGLAHAADLLRLVKSLHPDICCGVGGYPKPTPNPPPPPTTSATSKRRSTPAPISSPPSSSTPTNPSSASATPAAATPSPSPSSPA